MAANGVTPRISVVINTRNEERNLPQALRSVAGWVDEIVVVDMESEDRTVEIAREFGANVYHHERTAVVDAARGFAIERATGDWVLLLDADEMIPAALAERLRIIAREARHDVVRLPRLNYLLGSALRATGWGPLQDLQWRFFRKECMRVSDVIHDFLHPSPDARLLVLSEPGLAIVHFNYLDVDHFLEKLNRYTTVEAVQAYARGERYHGGAMLWRAVREFGGRYLRRGGYRDGWRGLCLSLLMAGYRIATFSKLAELEHAGRRDEVQARYAAEAERLLAAYPGSGRTSSAKVS